LRYATRGLLDLSAIAQIRGGRTRLGEISARFCWAEYKSSVLRGFTGHGTKVQ
jgi:hypothetical protein